MKKESLKCSDLKESFPTMRKSEVIDRVFLKTGMSKEEIKIILETFMDVIGESIFLKRNVSLRGFMNFQIKKQTARKARNIKKEETVFIPDRYKAVGKFSKNILDKLNELNQF